MAELKPTTSVDTKHPETEHPEDCVSMVDVLEEEQKLEEDANAVLGGSDVKHCTYPQGALSRQALYACATCVTEDKTQAGVCLACSLECHEGHDLYELYTKRNFTCDCGNSKFGEKKCKLCPEKTELNPNNKYNQNFHGKYCICHRPYPDPEVEVEDEMIQCVVCEDWYHGRHLKADIPDDNNYEEMTCFRCVERLPFLTYYQNLQALASHGEVVSLHRDDSAKHNIDVCSDSKPQTTDNSTEGTTHTDKAQPKPDSDIKAPEKSEGSKTECQLEHLKSSASSSSRSTAQRSLFWSKGWRSKLCLCSSCKDMYLTKNVGFIAELSDTITAYEEQGKQGKSSQYEQGMEALSQMDRVQQVEMLHGFNDLKSELKDYLKKFAENGKVVKEEDIKEFFSELASRKRQRTTNMSYFCK